MAGERKAQDRALQRSFECHRLEEQMWSLAYQEVWPVIRQKPKAERRQTKQRSWQAIAGGFAEIARRA